MTSTPSPARRASDVSPVLGRRLILIALAAAVACALLTLSFAYADHAPAPHDVSVAVVAPPAARVRLAAGLQRAAPGAFRAVDVPSVGAAREALRDQRVRGALILGPRHRARVLTAGAAGLTLQQVVETALTRLAAAAGARPTVHDVVPLSAADRSGLSTFVFELGLLVPSVLGSVGLYLVGLRARLWWRVAAAGLYAALAAGCATVILAAGFGALPGHGAALFGVGVLGALAFLLPIAAAQATLGLPATGVMAILLIFVGNAVSGGSVPTGMLPDGYRQISPWLPNGAIVHAVRAVVYFGGHGIGQPLLALALWAGVGWLGLLAVDALHTIERRRAPEHAADIYATPGIVHAARRRRRSAEGRWRPAPSRRSRLRRGASAARAPGGAAARGDR